MDVRDGRLFKISYSGRLKGLFRLMGMGPGSSGVWVTADTVQVRLGRSFSTDFGRSAIAAAADDTGRVSGWGVHGGRGQWLVNGSSDGLVRISLDPPGKARVLGLPVKLKVLRVSVEESQALIAELGGPR